MTIGRVTVAAFLLSISVSVFAQEAPAPASQWTWRSRVELRGNFRDSKEQRVALKFPFPASFLPVGQKVGFEETVNSGTHAELSVAQVRLDLGYSTWFTAHTQFHVQDKYRRNPTSNDRKTDADELWIRFGEKPEILDRPEHTSFFLQLGKAPKMERQPLRLLESYGLAATAFNRMEDVQAMLGGTVGRNLYWRVVGSSGNPLFFRDPNALAGDNGIPILLTPNPDPHLKSGFPILYNAETEGYSLKRDHMQFGQGLGYRWQRDDGTLGFDAIVFHYRRTMADEQKLTGTFYGADTDLLNGPEVGGKHLFPLNGLSGNTKEETGARIYAEWKNLTMIGQFTKQLVAGLHREGFELESGYRLATSFGPSIGGENLFQFIQPALRLSGLKNRFKGPLEYPSPSVWWNWIKFDYGVRIGFAKNVDITAEHAKHNVVNPSHVKPDETLVTVRVRI